MFAGKVSRNLKFLIFPCVSPNFGVYGIFIQQVICSYFTPLPKIHANVPVENPFCQNKSVGCGGTYLEPMSRFHGYFIIVVLKRSHFPLPIILHFCISQYGRVLKVA